MTRNSRQPVAYLLPMLFLMVPVLFGMYRLERGPWIRQFLFERHQADWLRHSGRCNLAGPFLTITDRVMLDDAFTHPVAGKRVYLFGGCTMEEVLDTRVLPVPRSELGIYSLPNCNYEGLDSVTRWLVSGHRLGARLGPETLVLVGLATDLVEPERAPQTREHFIGSGLYEWDGAGIRLKPMARLARRFGVARQRLAHLIYSVYQARPHHRILQPPIGERWELDAASMSCQLEALDRILERMKGTGATVRAVYLPNGSWSETPTWARVRTEIMALCRAKGVPMLDLTGQLEDQDFLDGANHLTRTGQQKTNRLLAPLVLSYLGGQAGYSDCRTVDHSWSPG